MATRRGKVEIHWPKEVAMGGQRERIMRSESVVLVKDDSFKP